MASSSESNKSVSSGQVVPYNVNQVNVNLMWSAKPYRQSSVVSRESAKLSPRFFGPYKVLARVGPVAYRLALPPGSLVHNVFHVSMLKRCVGSVPPSSPVPADAPVTALSPSMSQHECVLEERVVQKGKYRPKTEVLVKWVGRPSEEATWETKWRFRKAYPTFHLEDKANASGVDCYVSADPVTNPVDPVLFSYLNCTQFAL
ncbi:uncharacterized protein LOC110913365 [Helianthus annuus]|uniref:uncharacterized protein LOC110913365 n=1 Tax=Helianthus annuus TaxID=4232 RepID=UPI000B8FE262|nr:uncharacterized protein LOC110913365 [Helianthus annuus]